MEGFIFSQSGQTIQEILTYVEQRLPGTLQALEKAIGDEATRATNKENELLSAIGGLIPKSEKGAANGVASLNGGGQVPNDQLQWSMRGVLNPSDIDSTSLVAGIYQVNGKVLSPDILDGDAANGVMVQYPWGSRVQLLLVGRTGGAASGEQVETYVRRYLTGPQRWTQWSKSAGGGQSVIYNVKVDRNGDIYTPLDSWENAQAAYEAGKLVVLSIDNNGGCYLMGNYEVYGHSFCFYSMGGVGDSQSLAVMIWTRDQLKAPKPFNALMSQAEAKAGTATNARTISASLLKQAILYHTSALITSNLLIVNGDGMEASHSSTEIVAAVTSGKMPVLKVGNKFFLLYSTADGSASFRRMDGLGNIQGYAVDQYNQLAEEVLEPSIGQIPDVYITQPRKGQVLVYLPEHVEEEMIVPAGWYNRTLTYPSMSQYDALVARVAALEQNQ